MRIKQGVGILAATMLAVGNYANSITHGSTTLNMDFVDIGYAGNAGDLANTVNGLNPGSVGYNYRIGKFEVTAGQWASVIAADSNVGNTGSWAGSQPTGSATWYEAAKFANWLTTGNAYIGAYQFDGSGLLINVMTRAEIDADGGFFYVLPTEDEWYKAAFFKSDGSGYTTYSTGDTLPAAGLGGANYANAIGNPWNVGTGIVENNGTFDMAGNAVEWMESAYDGNLNDLTESRVFRGESYTGNAGGLESSERFSPPPTLEQSFVGFRVVAIPEPSTMAFVGIFGSSLWFIRRYFSM